MSNKNFIEIDGIKLEAKWLESEKRLNKSVLVFLHEGLGCVDLWKEFPDRLSHNLSLPSFLYSRQGYGRSDPVSLPRNEQFMHREGLDILPKILDTTKISSAVLIGHSDGASIAIINAGGLKDPRIKAIVLIAAHVFVEEISIESIKKAKTNFENTDLENRLRKYHHDNVNCAFWGWNDIWLKPTFRNWNIEEYLPEIKIPTLVIQGNNDEYGTLEQVKAIENGIDSQAQISIIPNCGHTPHNEQREITLDIITDFLKKIC